MILSLKQVEALSQWRWNHFISETAYAHLKYNELTAWQEATLRNLRREAKKSLDKLLWLSDGQQHDEDGIDADQIMIFMEDPRLDRIKLTAQWNPELLSPDGEESWMLQGGPADGQRYTVPKDRPQIIEAIEPVSLAVSPAVLENAGITAPRWTYQKSGWDTVAKCWVAIGKRTPD